jgi:hypothetical protein
MALPSAPARHDRFAARAILLAPAAAGFGSVGSDRADVAGRTIADRAITSVGNAGCASSLESESIPRKRSRISEGPPPGACWPALVRLTPGGVGEVVPGLVEL